MGVLGRLVGTMRTLTGIGLRLILLAALVWAAHFGFTMWQHARLISRSQDQIVNAINLSLAKSQLETISTVQFTNTSLRRTVPEILLFETPVFQKESPGRQSAGTLKGQLDRSKRQLEIKIFNTGGVCESDYVVAVTEPR